MTSKTHFYTFPAADLHDTRLRKQKAYLVCLFYYYYFDDNSMLSFKLLFITKQSVFDFSQHFSSKCKS